MENNRAKLERYGWKLNDSILAMKTHGALGEELYQTEYHGYDIDLVLATDTGLWATSDDLMMGVEGYINEWVPNPRQAARAGAWGWEQFSLNGWRIDGYMGEGHPLPFGVGQVFETIDGVVHSVWLEVELVDPKTGLVHLSATTEGCSGVVELYLLIDLMPAPEYAGLLVQKQRQLLS